MPPSAANRRCVRIKIHRTEQRFAAEIFRVEKLRAENFGQLLVIRTHGGSLGTTACQLVAIIAIIVAMWFCVFREKHQEGRATAGLNFLLFIRGDFQIFRFG